MESVKCYMNQLFVNGHLNEKLVEQLKASGKNVEFSFDLPVDYEAPNVATQMDAALKRDRYVDLLDERQTAEFAQVVNALRQNNVECRFEEGFTPEQAIVASRKMNDWTREILTATVDGQPLSPLEKYYYAFDIATQFVYTLEDEGQAPTLSRRLIDVLSGDKICCVGYAGILMQLCKRVGIDCERASAKEIAKGGDGHALCTVFIDDPKYGICGTYFADPTGGSPKPEDHIGQNFQSALLSDEEIMAWYASLKKPMEINTFYEKSLAIKRIEQSLMERFPDDTYRLRQEEYLQEFNENLERLGERKADFVQLLEEKARQRKDVPKETRQEKREKTEDLVKQIIRPVVRALREDESVYVLGDAEREILDRLVRRGLSVEEIVKKVGQQIDQIAEWSDEQKILTRYDRYTAREATPQQDERYRRFSDKMHKLDDIETTFNTPSALATLVGQLRRAIHVVAEARGMDDNEAAAFVVSRMEGKDPDEQARLVAQFEENAERAAGQKAEDEEVEEEPEEEPEEEEQAEPEEDQQPAEEEQDGQPAQSVGQVQEGEA